MLPRPFEMISVDVWSDTYRVLSSSVASKPGKMKIENVECARAPHRAITEKGVETITCCIATQLFKTTLLENVIGYHAHLDPCPMLVVQPKTDTARAFSKERLSTLIRATPVLTEIFGDTQQDQSESSQFYKEFAGGFLALASAGSPIELAMRPIQITLMDEIDKYEPTKEGDPVLLGEERTATFSGRSLKVRCSSPTLEDTSRIWQSYRESDMRRPFLNCPHCNSWFTPEWSKNVHWPKGANGEHLTDQATFTCDHGCPISESERHKMLTTKNCIQWRQTKPFTCCGVEQNPLTTQAWEWDEENLCGYAICATCGTRTVSNRHIGFNGNKLLSPWADATIPKLAAKWIAAQTDPLAKQVFWNTQLALPFQSHDSKRIEVHTLEERLEQFPPQLPKDLVRVHGGGRLPSRPIGDSHGRMVRTLRSVVAGLPRNSGKPGGLSNVGRTRLIHFEFAIPFGVGSYADCSGRRGHRLFVATRLQLLQTAQTAQRLPAEGHFTKHATGRGHLADARSEGTEVARTKENNHVANVQTLRGGRERSEGLLTHNDSERRSRAELFALAAWPVVGMVGATHGGISNNRATRRDDDSKVVLPTQSSQRSVGHVGLFALRVRRTSRVA